ncbi:hypothetical protein M948_03340 [Virgibacillus sp. CM-4]|uniref:penicillin acylase family protein n=1 Tax=Virgibacillus sp. CM-4 TaxID=1354277 RepID=UPI00038825C0|nr:penicillin acylase family protein [Virgibacillus sp. CM-4]EQB37597.1 hypothetical protein M948_03340 [Virgibacillus sp. CM-4]
MEERVFDKQPHRQERKKKKFAFITSGILLLTIGSLILFVNAFIGRSVEQVNGTINLPILKEQVQVITDENGVPHIKAANDHDLYVAQGYVQAQYRLFQMEMSRRQASGTLSEVVGEAAIDQDKYFRTLGLRRAATKSYDIYSEQAKQVLQYFSDGVNAYVDEAIRTNRLPIEFTLMGIKPEAWTPIDSLTIGKYMAFDLGGHWERQAFNYYLLQNYPENKAYELFPDYPEEKPVIMEEPYVSIPESFDKAIIPPAFNGSNNWVVSGDKTASGLPLLADDPHLGLATPSIWLQMQLESDTNHVSGVIFAGVPGIILGHNDTIAWGVTNTGPDVQQLYLEKQHPERENQFYYEGKWEKATVIEEPIKVKNEETLDYHVVETRHGPIISEFAEESGKDTMLSLRWTALEPTTELEAILEINRASDWSSFEKGLEKFLVPAQNFVFAQKNGTIAYKANGNIPIYQDGTDALLPLPGWEKESEWKGYIPFEQLPRIVNPAKGYIATANNKITTEDYPYHISNVWAQPYRYERIAEVLESSNALTVRDMQDLQMDTKNMQAEEFVPVFLSILRNMNISEKEKQAVNVMKKWDYHDEATAVQPLIFHHWMNELEAIIYQDIPDNMMDLFGSRGQTTDELIRKSVEGKDAIWVENAGGLQQVVKDALTNSLNKLENDFGKKMNGWQWGDYHQVSFRHPLSEINPVLEFFFNNEAPLPVGGSKVTPMAAAYKTETGIVNHGASWRFVVDMEEPKKGYHIVGPGQSGHFKSDWYHDQLTDWVHGSYHETTLSQSQGNLLIFQPE